MLSLTKDVFTCSEIETTYLIQVSTDCTVERINGSVVQWLARLEYK